MVVEGLPLQDVPHLLAKILRFKMSAVCTASRSVSVAHSVLASSRKMFIGVSEQPNSGWQSHACEASVTCFRRSVSGGS